MIFETNALDMHELVCDEISTGQGNAKNKETKHKSD